MKIRKQEDNLTTIDLIKFPVWEYALDEEQVEDQNEKTLSPYIKSPAHNQTSLLVRATFELANGIVHVGYIKPLEKGENKLMHPLLPYDLTPVIVTDQGHVAFCYGIYKPDAATLLENYKRLGKESDNVFPIKFKADIYIRNSVSDGVLEGFLYFEQNPQNYFRLKSSDMKFVK